MNEKFFDLKKEKQDRMVNAGLRIFALNGYKHASTDDIVKEAQISKGLLFHYFGSKSGYYSFLYDYTTRYAILELTGQVRSTQGLDYFELQRQLLQVESDLMEQYPCLLLFLESVRLEDDEEGKKSLEVPEMTVHGLYTEMQKNADLSGYIRVDSETSLSGIIHHVKTGVMREVLSNPEGTASEYASQMNGYLATLQHLASNL